MNYLFVLQLLNHNSSDSFCSKLNFRLATHVSRFKTRWDQEAHLVVYCSSTCSSAINVFHLKNT